MRTTKNKMIQPGLSIFLLAIIVAVNWQSSVLAQGKGKGGKKDPPAYTVVDLGEHQSQAWAVSEPTADGSVQVGGDTHISGWQPIFWTVEENGSFVPTYPGLPPGANGAHITDMNDWGMITVWTSGADAGWYLMPGGNYQQLPFANATGFAAGLNNLADIVGGTDFATGWGGALWLFDGTGYPAPRQLDFFAPFDITDDGVMVGNAYNSVADRLEGARAWIDGSGNLQVQLLGVLPGESYSDADAISSNGQWVIGTSGQQAYVWSAATGMNPLGTLGGLESRAMAVNDSGQVVGWSDVTQGYFSQAAFLWDGGNMSDLNQLAQTGHRPHLVFATGINNAGHIVGFTRTSRSNSDQHGFVLIPTGTE